MYFVMLGAPGSGKGTQAYRLSQKFAAPHVSSGDLLRNNPDLPDHIRKIIDTGGFLSDEMITDIVQKKLTEPAYNHGWILDGFPRTLKQAESLEKMASKPPLVIYLLVDEEEIKKRLGLRRTCQGCGAIFHLVTHPPKKENKCDICQGKLIQREDDTPKVVEKRLSLYNERTAPLIQFYRDKGRLLTIDCRGEQNVDEVFHLILNHVKTAIAKIDQR